MRGKPEMYQLWLSKQSTGFCATGVNMGHWFDATVAWCLNCSCLAETADHLLRCRDAGRTKLFEDAVIALEEWMESHYTDPRLARMVSLFLQHRGNRTFALLPGLDRDLLELAYKQEATGWDDLMEGKIIKHFQVVQSRFLPRCPTMLNASNWTKQFINQLIHITHSQWIYCNISKNHSTHIQLERLDLMSLLRHINKFARVAPSDVPQEIQFFLRVRHTGSMLCWQQSKPAGTALWRIWTSPQTPPNHP
jgi:hypothetical protein